MHSPQELSRSATLDASECCGTSAIRVEEALLAGRNAYSTCFACCELEAAAYNALPNGCMCFMKPHAGAKCWRRAKERTRLDWVRLVTCVRGRSIIVTKCLLLSERSLSVCAARSCHAILLYMLSHTPRHSHSLARLKALLKYAELELTRAKAGHVQHTKRSHDVKQSLCFFIETMSEVHHLAQRLYPRPSSHRNPDRVRSRTQKPTLPVLYHTHT